MLPLDIYFAWLLPLSDETMRDAVRTSAQTIKQKAQELGQDIQDAFLYPNYAIYDTPLEQMYGGNLPVLHAIKEAIDPNGVMDLAGGFKF